MAAGEVLLTGTQLGTPGSFGSSGAVIAHLLDANDLTNWQGPDPSGDWAGMDAGVVCLITRVRISPRGGYEDFCLGSIQGDAADATFAAGAVTLYTNSVRPLTGTLLTEWSVPNGGNSYRYFRYLSGSNQFGGPADLDFIVTYTSGVVGSVVTPVITPPGGQFDQPTIVQISSITTDAAFFYTTDGTTPTISSTPYAGPFAVNGIITLKVLGTSASLGNSRIASAYFAIPSTVISTNDIFDSNRGYRVWAIDGCTMFDPVGTKWYRYGINYDMNGVGTEGLIGVHTYSSADLRNWKFENVILAPTAGNSNGSASLPWLERPIVVYNALYNNYVLWIHHWLHVPPGLSAYTAPSPLGPWTLRATYATLDVVAGTDGDMNIFIEPSDGVTAYLVRVGAASDTTLFISKMTPDYIGTTTPAVNYPNSGSSPFGQKSEAPHMFKRGSTYFWQASPYLTWQPGLNLYVTSSSPLGPWSAPVNAFQFFAGGNPDNTTGFDSQNDQILQLPGRDDGSGLGAFVYLGDRYDTGLVNPTLTSAVANFQGYKKLFLPITFPTATTMQILWNPSWTFDTAFQAVSGSPVAPTSLSVGPGSGFSWVNNELNPHCLYLDSSPNANFSPVTQSEVISLSQTPSAVSYTPIVSVALNTWYRVRAVNARGTTTSAPFIAGRAPAAGGPAAVLYSTGFGFRRIT